MKISLTGLKKHQAEAATVKERATKAVSGVRSELTTANEQVNIFIIKLKT